MRADRLLAILLRLQLNYHTTASALAKEFEVSKRTIYRDIEALSTAGIPIYTQAGSNGGIFLDEAFRTSITGLTEIEVGSLFVSHSPDLLRDLGYGEAIQNALLKLLVSMPPSIREAAKHVQQRVYIDPIGWFHADEPLPFLDVLQQAVWESRTIEAIYRRRDETISNRRINPYGLVAKAGGWYVVGQAGNKQMQTFRVSRLQDVQLTNHQFERDPIFDLEMYWKNASKSFEFDASGGFKPVQATVRIDAEVVWHLVNDPQAKYVQLTSDPETGRLTIRLTFRSEVDARVKVLSLGDQVEVLEPPELRQVISTIAKNMHSTYS